MGLTNFADVTILEGDSLLILPTLPENSVDAVVTDPPYELGFMGKAWDKTGIAYNVQFWREVLRVLKPGGHLLAFGGTRTYHRMACAIEDAGFEIRDQLQWIYGSGFPKSLDVGKAVDALQNNDREVVGEKHYGDGKTRPNVFSTKNSNEGWQRAAHKNYKGNRLQTRGNSEWEGFGTALKPANEPICLARKPLEKGLKIAQNVLKWGTGSINIDGCRIEVKDADYAKNCAGDRGHENNRTRRSEFALTSGTASKIGRFPTNVIHDGSDEVLEHFPDTKAGGSLTGNEPSSKTRQGEIYGKIENRFEFEAYDDAGSAARFFYCAKASKAERNAGLDGLPIKRPDTRSAKAMGSFEEKGVQPQQNHHPTVKPLALMQYLCRLITPPGGKVLDPFCGSGTTGKAAIIERFTYIGIDKDPEYVEISCNRLNKTQVKLF